jgi:hypothetical protein
MIRAGMGKDHDMQNSGRKSKRLWMVVLVALPFVFFSDVSLGVPINFLVTQSGILAVGGPERVTRETRFRSAMGTTLMTSQGDWATNGVSFHWGLAGDVPILADFDGDGEIDPSVLRRTEGTVWTHFSAGGPDQAIPVSGDANPSVTDDFDGDGKDDLAWVEVQDRQFVWTVELSLSGQPKTFVFGKSSDVALTVDENGDGRAEAAVLSIAKNKRWLTVQGKKPVAVGSASVLLMAVPSAGAPDRIFSWEPKTGEWFLQASGKSTSLGVLGTKPDLPIPADYDGDGSIDKAVWSGRTRFITYAPGNGPKTKTIPAGRVNSQSLPLLATLVR